MLSFPSPPHPIQESPPFLPHNYHNGPGHFWLLPPPQQQVHWLEVGDKAEESEVPGTAAVVLPPSQQHVIGGEAGLHRSDNGLSGGFDGFRGKGGDIEVNLVRHPGMEALEGGGSEWTAAGSASTLIVTCDEVHRDTIL